jgi:hypothetical protein
MNKSNLSPGLLEAEVTTILRTLNIVMVGLRDLRKRARTGTGWAASAESPTILRLPAALAADIRLVADALRRAEDRMTGLNWEANPPPSVMALASGVPAPEMTMADVKARNDKLRELLDETEADKKADLDRKEGEQSDAANGDGDIGAWLRRQLDGLDPKA